MERANRTNNSSEGWHDHFRVVVGKDHADLYSCLTEFQKEQAFTETCLAELALGKKVKGAPKKRWIDLRNRIQGIVTKYTDYKNDDIIGYLQTIGHNITIT